MEQLLRSGQFGATLGAAQGLYVSKGVAACAELRRNGGDVDRARLQVAEGLAAASQGGWSDPLVTPRAIAIVDAAVAQLCPGAAVR